MKKHFFSTSLLSALFLHTTVAYSSTPVPASSVLGSAAKKALQTNIVQLESGPYLTAGQFQFHTLWTRDFAWASRGLFLMNRADVVKNHLSTLLSHVRTEDGLVPKTMDSMNPQSRVFLATLDLLWGTPVFRPLENPIRPYFMDENGSEAIDSNALVLLTALQYLEHSGDHDWWRQNESKLIQVYRFYQRYLDSDGLISQKPHADWQDSVARSGKTFYTHLIYYIVSKKLTRFESFGIHPTEVQKLKNAIQKTFYDPELGVYRSLEKGPYVSLDGNLLAIDLGYFDGDKVRQKNLYDALKKHPVFWGKADLPGSNTFPDYPKEWLSKAPKISGLRHYHDRLYWSWLMGLSGKVAVQMGDRSTQEKMLATLQTLIDRDGTILEIYRARPELTPWQSRLYRSERPFSWGAAFVLDFAHQL